MPNNAGTELQLSKLGFRKAGKADAEALIEIYNSSFYDDYVRYGECPAYGRSREMMEQSIADYPKHLITYDGRPVGCISCREIGKGVYEVGCLCVIPDFQGKGIGTAAMKFAKTCYPDWNRFTLVTPADKKENVKFYTEKCGFSIRAFETDGNVKVARFLLERKVLLRTVAEDDLPEVARTWPSDHRPVSGEEARGAISYMHDSEAKNTKGRIFHLCLAVCREDNPGTIMGWCGLDGRRNREEPEIFILLDEEYRNQGYGTQCVKELLRIAAEDYSLQSVHGGCDKDNIASKRAMEKGGMVQYGTEENGDPLFRFTAKEKGEPCKRS